MRIKSPEEEPRTPPEGPSLPSGDKEVEKKEWDFFLKATGWEKPTDNVKPETENEAASDESGAFFLAGKK